MKEIMELVGVSTAERPIKGFALDKALYVAGTKQDVLDEQEISNERVANLVVWAKDITKFMVFSVDGSTHEEKDLPSGDVDISDLASLTGDNAFQGGSTYEGSTSELKSLMSREAVEALIPTGSTYDGEGFGVPGKTMVEDGTVVQTQITGNYRNNSDKAGNLTINVRTDDGVKNWRFYYNIPRGSISARKIYVKVDEKAGTNKLINSGETWKCEVKAGQFFDEFFWSQIMESASTFVLEEQFNAKSGITGVHSGGGSTLKIEYWENGKIFSVSNSTIEVRPLEGMDEDNKHGYVKYINTHGDDVDFEWYDRNGNAINNATVPTTCPANTVVEIFANYDTNNYFLSFSQSKVVASINEVAQTELFKMAAATMYDYPESNFVIKTED